MVRLGTLGYIGREGGGFVVSRMRLWFHIYSEAAVDGGWHNWSSIWMVVVGSLLSISVLVTLVVKTTARSLMGQGQARRVADGSVLVGPHLSFNGLHKGLGLMLFRPSVFRIFLMLLLNF